MARTTQTEPAESEPTAEVVRFSNESVFDDAALAAIGSFDDAWAAANAFGMDTFDEYGTGFSIVDDKRRLIGVPFVALEWRFNPGKFGTFVSVAIVTETGDKLILNDGSSGIREQLEMVTQQRINKGHPHPQAALAVKGGLRVSDYDYDDGAGHMIPASTFYLAS